MCVSVGSPGNNSYGGLSPNSLVESGVTGAYVLSGLQPGRYKVRFDGCGQPQLASEYFGNTSVWSRSQWVTVHAGAVTRLAPFRARAAGVITGRVSLGFASTYFAGDCIDVFDAGRHLFVTLDSNNSFRVDGGFTRRGSGPYTGNLGPYILDGLAPGTYYVGFRPCFDVVDQFATQYYSGASTLASATPVVVRSGQTTQGIDVTLHPPTG